MLLQLKALFVLLVQFSRPSDRYGVEARAAHIALPIITGKFIEICANDAGRRLQREPVAVPLFVSPNKVPSSFIKWDAGRNAANKTSGDDVPLVLLHGFDSSCLEFRRLGPLLADLCNRDVYAPDVLGWGYGDYTEVLNFSPNAKMSHLKCFIEQVLKRPCILVGASLGGAIAINLAAEVCPELVRKVVLINAQVTNRRWNRYIHLFQSCQRRPQMFYKCHSHTLQYIK